MRTIMLLIALLTAGPAWATSLTWTYTDTSSSPYIAVNGTFTYDSEIGPNGFNVHGGDPNLTYPLSSWDFTVTTDFSTLSTLAQFSGTTTFSSTLAGNTSEFCVGDCIFSSLLFERLFFSNGEQSLQLIFNIPSLTPFSGLPPDSLEDWGVFNGSTPTMGGASRFRSNDAQGNFQVMVGLESGAITGPTIQPVPEPATLVFFLIGLAMVGWFHIKRRVL